VGKAVAYFGTPKSDNKLTSACKKL